MTRIQALILSAALGTVLFAPWVRAQDHGWATPATVRTGGTPFIPPAASDADAVLCRCGPCAFLMNWLDDLEQRRIRILEPEKMKPKEEAKPAADKAKEPDKKGEALPPPKLAPVDPQKAITKDDKKPEPKKEEKKKAWYEKYSIRGYAQIRTNETVYRDDTLAPAQHVGDRSVGDSQNILIRRARLILQGEVNEHVSIYLQPDFASSVPNSPDATHFVQIRDWYADVHVDKEKRHRFRIGQSKVPYGWENMQSSSNRLPLDRNDAFNSAVKNERDLGVFYYWTPTYAQGIYKYVMDKGLKGSGNYGVLGLGVYDGQGGSFVEQNNNLHIIGRLSWPFLFESGRIFELGVQAYTGKYTVLGSNIRPLGVGATGVIPMGTLEQGSRQGTRDTRVGWSAILYPQPIGLQAEWTIGRGPALNAAQTVVTEQDLHGGYITALAKVDTPRFGTMFPFVRWQYFRGGFKAERNAPYGRVNEWELGNEWQFDPGAELTVMYVWTNRTNTAAINSTGVTSYRQFVGNLIRIQFQVNY